MAILALGLAAAVLLSIFQLVDIVRHRWLGTLVMGKVKLQEHPDLGEGSGSPTYAPTFEYVADGKTLRLKSLMQTLPSLYEEGQEVAVYYFPSNPHDARVVTAREYTKWLLLGGISGLLLAGVLARSAGTTTLPAP